MTLPAATRLGPYEIMSALGAGGMGEVYRARDTRLNRVVAIKLLPLISQPTRASRERFAREARTISALNHPAARHVAPSHRAERDQRQQVREQALHAAR